MSTQALSDYNRPGHVSRKTSSSALFSDLNLTMPIHPNKKDITPLTDIDAVKAAVKNIVLTNFGEKLFMPRFGGNTTSYLFENVDEFTAIAIKNEIRDVVTQFERRITDLTIQVTNDIDTNSYHVTLGFKLANNLLNTETVEFALKRLR